MEVERNVKIQIVRDPDDKLKAGFSSGPHAGRRLPSYSQDERRLNLGSTMIDRIRSAFAPATKARKQSPPSRAAASQTVHAFSRRDGW